MFFCQGVFEKKFGKIQKSFLCVDLCYVLHYLGYEKKRGGHMECLVVNGVGSEKRWINRGKLQGSQTYLVGLTGKMV